MFAVAFFQLVVIVAIVVQQFNQMKRAESLMRSKAGGFNLANIRRLNGENFYPFIKKLLVLILIVGSASLTIFGCLLFQLFQ